MSSRDLLLHPLHISHGEVPKAVSPTCLHREIRDLQVLSSFAAELTEGHGSVAQTSRASWPPVFLGSGGMIVGTAGESGTVCRRPISLCFCEVTCLQAVHLQLIVVGRRECVSRDGQSSQGQRHRMDGAFVELWVLVVEADEAVLNSLLRAMSALGAIRSDFEDKIFGIDERPCGSGCSSTVHVARRIRHDSETRSGVILDSSLTEVEPEKAAAKVFVGSHGRSASDLATAEASLLIAAQRHPNVVGFYGLFTMPGAAEGSPMRWTIAMEFCSKGDLHDDLQANGPFHEHHAAEIGVGVLAALAHIHARGVVHRDVKAENILITEQGKPLLSDFGIASRLDDLEAMEQRCGSPGYAAPEVLNGLKYDSKVDVFSFGVLLYFLLCNSLPFSGADIATVLRRTLRCRVRFSSKVFSHVGQRMKHFVNLLLHKEPQDRPCAQRALRYVWHNWCCERMDRTEWLRSIEYQVNERPPATSPQLPAEITMTDAEDPVRATDQTRQADEADGEISLSTSETRVKEALEHSPASADSVAAETAPVFAAPDEIQAVFPATALDAEVVQAKVAANSTACFLQDIRKASRKYTDSTETTAFSGHFMGEVTDERDSRTTWEDRFSHGQQAGPEEPIPELFSADSILDGPAHSKSGAPVSSVEEVRALPIRPPSVPSSSCSRPPLFGRKSKPGRSQINKDFHLRAPVAEADAEESQCALEDTLLYELPRNTSMPRQVPNPPATPVQSAAGEAERAQSSVTDRMQRYIFSRSEKAPSGEGQKRAFRRFRPLVGVSNLRRLGTSAISGDERISQNSTGRISQKERLTTSSRGWNTFKSDDSEAESDYRRSESKSFQADFLSDSGKEEDDSRPTFESALGKASVSRGDDELREWESEEARRHPSTSSTSSVHAPRPWKSDNPVQDEAARFESEPLVDDIMFREPVLSAREAAAKASTQGQSSIQRAKGVLERGWFFGRNFRGAESSNAEDVRYRGVLLRSKPGDRLSDRVNTEASPRSEGKSLGSRTSPLKGKDHDSRFL